MDTIKRRKRAVNFTTLNNEFLQDKTLSWKAKGLIAYVMSLPDDWELNLSDLKNRSKDGRDGTAAGLNEIIEKGYCKRYQVRGNDGLFSSAQYMVCDTREFFPDESETWEPQTENPDTVKPLTDKPEPGKPETENPTLVNTNKPNTKKVNTNNINPANGFAASLFPDPEKVVTPEEEKAIKTLFRNSKVADKDLFLSKFKGPEFEKIDLLHYYNAVNDWSEAKTLKRTDRGWIATVNQFIRGDIEKKKLRLKIEFTGNQKRVEMSGAMEYLKGDF